MPIFLQDRPLLDRFREGRRAALDRVYRFYVSDVLKMIRLGFVSGQARVAGNRDRQVQLDLTQDIFVKAFKEPARLGYDGVRPYRPYLLRIGRNHLIDQLRRIGREVPLDTVTESEVAIAPEGEESLHWNRLRSAVRAYLASQSEELRVFVELRFEQDGSQAEVAQKMGVTRRRVRTLERRALDGLLAHLENAGLKDEVEAEGKVGPSPKKADDCGPDHTVMRRDPREPASSPVKKDPK